MPNKRSIVKGMKFGLLSIVRELEPISTIKENKRVFECVCSCGSNIKVTPRLEYLTSGKVKSCGCLRLRASHGLSKHPLYIVLNCMNNRCTSPKNRHYSDYGGRGIKVCKEWRIGKEGIKNFIAWNESLPKEQKWRKGLQIERIDNDGDYEPSNCRWATTLDQAKNKRVRKNSIKIEHKGKYYTIKDYFDEFSTGVTSLKTFTKRIKDGMPAIKAITKPNQMNTRY